MAQPERMPWTVTAEQVGWMMGRGCSPTNWKPERLIEYGLIRIERFDDDAMIRKDWISRLCRFCRFAQTFNDLIPIIDFSLLDDVWDGPEPEDNEDAQRWADDGGAHAFWPDRRFAPARTFKCKNFYGHRISYRDWERENRVSSPRPPGRNWGWAGPLP